MRERYQAVINAKAEQRALARRQRNLLSTVVDSCESRGEGQLRHVTGWALQFLALARREGFRKQFRGFSFMHSKGLVRPSTPLQACDMS
jgi:hypothetical protein